MFFVLAFRGDDRDSVELLFMLFCRLFIIVVVVILVVVIARGDNEQYL